MICRQLAAVGLTVSNPDGFNVDMGGFTNKQGGDIKLTNSDGSVKITTQDITDPKKQDEANINGSLTVTADRGDKATEADINNEGILNAAENITFNAADDVVIFADGNHMWRIIDNLLSNVIKYAMADTRVYIDVYKEDSKGVFVIKKYIKTRK